MAELALTAREVADLRAREKDACDNVREAEEKLMTLIERVHTDTMEAERLWKEWDNLLWSIEEPRIGIDPARQEHADGQQQIDHLEAELQRERDLKVVAESMSIELAVEVGQHQEEVRRLEAEVTQQRDEVHRLRADMDGRPLVSLVVFLPGIHGRPFDTVGIWLGQVSATSLAHR